MQLKTIKANVNVSSENKKYCKLARFIQYRHVQRMEEYKQANNTLKNFIKEGKNNRFEIGI